MAVSWWQQTKALFVKNVLLKKRAKRQTLFEMIFPLYLTLIITLVTLAVKNTTFTAELDPPIFGVAEPFAGSALREGYLAFAPNEPDIRAFIDFAVEDISEFLGRKPEVRPFNSSDEIYEAYLSDPDALWAAVIVESVPLTPNAKYTIRMKKNEYTMSSRDPSIPSTDSFFAPQSDCRNGSSSCAAGLYWTSGFTAIQYALDNALSRRYLSTDLPYRTVQQMPKHAYEDGTSSAFHAVSVMFFVMAFSPLVQYLMVNVVNEKEKGIKEGLYLMGMRPIAYWLSWYGVYAIMTIFPVLGMTIISKTLGAFKHSNPLLIFLILYFYAISIIMLAFVFTPFFSKGKVAGMAGSLANTIFSLLIFGLKSASVTGATKWAVSLASPCAAAVGLLRALELDQNGGLNFKNFSEGEFSCFDSLIMLLIDSVLYLMLAWYLDAIVPGNGPTRPWNFIFKFGSSTRSHSFELRTQGGAELHGEREAVPASFASSLAMDIQQVGKTFGEKRALDSVTLDLYQGQIFALLGHNGAGKSTLHSIITGILSPSEGTVLIYGRDIRNDRERDEIRAMMGVCPQHDLLYDMLTAEEHLVLFAGIKGLPPSTYKDAISRTLAEVDLTDQAKQYSTTLSGGQKRKLSVGIALIGDPRVLCLDEPSSGMDPYSRRKLWTLLQNKREGRITLLTTHYMEEADILADRKAILSRGRIKCVGSSLFLKSRFGVGYHLNVVRSRDCNVPAITSLLHSFVPEASQRDAGAELAFALPTHSTSAFPKLFQALDDGKSRLGIESYGVAMTTLEEVFLRLQDHEEHHDEAKDAEARALREAAKAGNIQGDESAATPLLSKAGKDIVLNPATRDQTSVAPPSWWMKVKALMSIRKKETFRKWRALFFQILLPPVLMTISMTVVAKPGEESQSHKDPTPLVFDAGYYAQNLNVPWMGDARNVPFIGDFGESQSFLRAHNSMEQILNGTFVGPDGYLTHSTQTNVIALNFPDPTSSNLTLLFNDTMIHALPIFLSQLTNASLISKGSVQVTAHPFPYQSTILWDPSVFYTVLLLGIGLSAPPGGFAIDIVKDRKTKTKHQLMVSGTPFSVYWASYFLFNCLMLAWPVSYALVLAAATHIKELIGVPTVITVLLFITYIPLSLLFTYVVSFVFSDPDTAQSTWPPLNNFIAFVPYVVVGTLDFSQQSHIAKILHYVFCIIDPPYTLLGGLFYEYRVSLFARITSRKSEITLDDYLKTENNVLPTLFIMWAQCIVLFGILYLIEKGPELKRRFFANPPPLVHPQDARDDVDVIAERERAKQIVPGRDEMAVCVQELEKVFPKPEHRHKCTGIPDDGYHAAVAGVSFCVESGEVFGLLGPNGAGKTSTLSILTGEQSATHGDAFITGHSIHQDTFAAFHYMGYCPQFSALWELITVSEHLFVHAQLGGFSAVESRRRVNFFLEHFGISEYANIQSVNLSGGTKRKLSVAIAMIRNPSVLLLDEPSCGMDPGARRVLWDVIQASMVGRAAILTTHSMEEADALCTRIGIMVKGRLECVGTPTHLKGKYGDGYTLELKSADESAEVVHEFVMSKFPGAACIEQFGGRRKYKVQIAGTSLAKVFGLLEENKHALKIEDYAFSQATLEQVFLEFAKKQDIADS